jgi:hypothetical protein
MSTGQRRSAVQAVKQVHEALIEGYCQRSAYIGHWSVPGHLQVCTLTHRATVRVFCSEVGELLLLRQQAQELQ